MSLKLKLAALALLLIVLCLIFLPGDVKLIPADLVGIYDSPAPQYVDRYLKLSESTVIFGTGGMDIDIFFVSSVENEVAGAETRFHIHLHRSSEDEEHITLVRAEDADVIWFQNRPQTHWRRQAEQGSETAPRGDASVAGEQ